MRIFLTFTLFCFISIRLFSQTSDTIKTKNIQEVVIKGQKKPVVQTEKGTILNVSGTNLEQKDDANEILKFAPTVSQINGLKILGSDKIQMVLNGKEVKIKPEQFSTFLSSIGAKAIKSIEIIDRPDASLDSKYTSQIIINTKNVEGIEASLGAGMNYNFKFGQNTNANVLASLGKMNVYISGNFFERFSEFNGNDIQNIETKNINRIGTNKGSLKRFGYNGTMNLNYDFNQNHKLSFLYDYTVDEDLDKKFNYDYLITTPSISDSTISTRNLFENIDKTHTFSLQYIYKNDKRGDQLTLNSDYAIDHFNLPFESLSDYYRNNNLIETEDITQNTKLSYNIFTASADYKKTINEKNNYSLGLKFSHAANLNIMDYYDRDNFITENSQHFNFYEKIYSSYVKYSYKPGKFSYDVGLRNEFTDDQFHTNKNFSGKSSYNSLLPSVSVSYMTNKNNMFNFYVGKEIFRPSFFSYDPTIFFSPPNEKSSGNENLKPVKTYKIQSEFTFNQKYSLALQYTYSSDNIVYIPKVSEQYIFTKPENAGYQNQVLLMLNLPVKFTNFWESVNKFNFIYKDFHLPELAEFYKSFFSSIESTQSFYLPKNIFLDINMSYSSPYRNKYNYNYSNFICGFSAVIPIVPKTAVLRLGISDLFNSGRNKFYSDINGIYQYNYSKYKGRDFFLKFTFNFKSGKETEDIYRDSSVREMLYRTGK